MWCYTIYGEFPIDNQVTLYSGRIDIAIIDTATTAAVVVNCDEEDEEDEGADLCAIVEGKWVLDYGSKGAGQCLLEAFALLAKQAKFNLVSGKTSKKIVVGGFS